MQNSAQTERKMKQSDRNKKIKQWQKQDKASDKLL